MEIPCHLNREERYMWMLVGGKITESTMKVLERLTDKKFQGVESVLDVVNTLLTKGVDHFEGIEGVVVLASGCDSIVDLGWMLQLDRLGVPIYYYSHFEQVNLDKGLEHLKNIHTVAHNPLKVKMIAQDINKGVEVNG